MTPLHARVHVLLVGCLVAAALTPSGRSADGLAPGARVWLHAHNCYPDKGQWTDRIERALSTGLPYLAIEQDLAWSVDASGRGRPVVSHETKVTGREPTLEAHFFDRIRPLMERALAENRRDTWPILVLHLDFKTNEAAHHQAVWDLLGRHEPWLTTAERTADERQIAPLVAGPLLVLTEAGEGQADVFHDRVPAGSRLRLFGTVPSGLPSRATPEERAAAAAAAAPDMLIPTGATNYRRWTNFPWAVVEEGGQRRAGRWTPEERLRLDAIVRRAHDLGLWVRFYTLNGHAPGAGSGWSESYNFGSIEAVRPRWRAAVEAGVDFVATDQYEQFARVLRP